MWDSLYLDCHLASMDPDVNEPFGAIRNGALAINDGTIAWIGPESALPDDALTRAKVIHRLNGAWLTPGLVDCHTHMIFGGNRAHEFDMRLNGKSYEEIAAQGGGIQATVKATREATETELYESALRRLDRMRADGITTIEIKSGYGLDRETELRMLKVAARLERNRPVRVMRTFLGAHAIPKDYPGGRAGYVDFLISEMIPEIAKNKLAHAVDGFCETIGFTTDEIDRLFKAARSHGLHVKLHAEQLSDQGGAALAAKHGALSADHLEYLSQDGIDAMAASGTVAVLLPAAFYVLRETRLPPIGGLRRAGVPMAIASDCNPGTAPVLSPGLIPGMASTLFRLTPEEAISGMTIHAARALGLADSVGQLRVGFKADIAAWAVGDLAEMCYWVGSTKPLFTLFNGQLAYESHEYRLLKEG